MHVSAEYELKSSLNDIEEASTWTVVEAVVLAPSPAQDTEKVVV